MLAILEGVSVNGVSSSTSSSSPPIKNGAAREAAPSPVRAVLPKLNAPALSKNKGFKKLWDYGLPAVNAAPKLPRTARGAN